MKNEPIPGVDKFLYHIYLYKNDILKAKVKVIAYDKLQALLLVNEYCHISYNKYDYKHIRPANNDENIGVILTKNDLKIK